MIKRIIFALIAFFILAFLILWVLEGGFQDIEVAVGHYRNPLNYQSIHDWFFQVGTTTGETFKLPGTPSNYPEVGMPQSSSATSSDGPTTVYQTGSNGGNGMQ